MEILEMLVAGIGGSLVLIVALILGVMALLVPVFVYSISNNVAEIQRDIRRLVTRDDAPSTADALQPSSPSVLGLHSEAAIVRPRGWMG
jgi:hypothetical protein